MCACLSICQHGFLRNLSKLSLRHFKILNIISVPQNLRISENHNNYIFFLILLYFDKIAKISFKIPLKNSDRHLIHAKRIVDIDRNPLFNAHTQSKIIC